MSFEPFSLICPVCGQPEDPDVATEILTESDINAMTTITGPCGNCGADYAVDVVVRMEARLMTDEERAVEEPT